MPHHVFKPKRMKNDKRVQSKIWWGQYRLDGDPKYTRLSLGVTDKRVAERKLEELVRDLERERAGLLSPKGERDAAAMPLSDLLEQFIEELKARGRSRDYWRKIEQRVQRVLTDLSWKYLRDVNREQYLAWRRKLTVETTLNPRTINHFTDAVRNFLGWLVQGNRLSANPFVSITPLETRGRESKRRRALTDEEARRLIAVSPKRKLVYLLALRSGLRRKELELLRWSDVFLDGPQPRLVVRAANAKSKREEAIPLTSEVVDALVAAKPSPGAVGRVFSSGIPNHHTFRADLEKAGIPYKDREGQTVDFHGLRKTFCTSLARAGVTLQTAMRLMRHTDPKLTARVYVDAGQLPTSDAVASLPSLLSQDAHIDAHESVAECDSASSTVASSESEIGENIPTLKQKGVPKHAQSPAVASRRKSGAGGNRTPVSVQSACRFYACSRCFHLAR